MITTATLHLRLRLIWSHICDYRLPWEFSTVAVSWVTYAWIMALVVVLAGTSACAAIQNGAAPAYTEPLAGQISPVHFGAVLTQIERITTGQLHGMIFYNPNNRVVVYAWQHLQGYAFICLNGQMSICNAIRDAGSRGTYVNANDFSGLMVAVQKFGYRSVAPDELMKLAPGLVTSILERAAGAAATAATSLPNIIVVPATLFQDMPSQEGTLQ